MRDETVCWVDFEPETTDKAEVREAYQTVAGGNGRVHNLYKAMSLSPAAIAPADQLYRQLLHNDDCPFEPWLRELISVQVAMICECRYATVHHGENFHDLVANRERSEALLDTVRGARWRDDLDDVKLSAILSFNDRLARAPEAVRPKDVDDLRQAGLSDKEVVYLAQISASFAYWSRIINALGISIGDEPIGLAEKSGKETGRSAPA